MNLKKILKEEATWYFLALAGLWILLYMDADVIIDTYFYMISLNILIFLFSYIILRIKNKIIINIKHLSVDYRDPKYKADSFDVSNTY